MAINVAQRAANAFVWFFLKEFEKIDAPFVYQLRLDNPHFDDWCKERGERAALLWMCCYTDDHLWVVTGADRVVRAVKLHHAVAELFGLLPSSFDKWGIGISTTWIGITSHVLFGLTEVPETKAAKGVVELMAALGGKLDSQEAVSLMGLLEHCKDALGMYEQSLFAMWYAIDRSEAAASYCLTGVAADLARSMICFLSSCRGSAIVDLVDFVPPDLQALALSIFSDAALRSIKEAGMGGFLIGYFWRVPLAEGLQGLTIPVLEFLAARVNLVVLHALMLFPISCSCPMWIRWEVDAITARFALRNHSA